MKILRLAAQTAILLTTSVASAEIPDAVPLWQQGAPGAKGKEESDTPTLRYYAAANPSGAAVIVCPGGGYGVLAYDHEGHQAAQWLARHRVAAFVLRYRHSPKYHHPIPLQDAQRAIRQVRSQAVKHRIDPQRIGIMGFSAGGHLASTAATHYDNGAEDAKDPVDRLRSRPDFAILCYPVISMIEPWGHRGSRRNLLGARADDDKLAASLSSDRQVTSNTPRTFLFHTAEDKGVPVRNSLAFYQALMDKGVPAELHVYQNGPHGVGLAQGNPTLSSWPDRLLEWLQASNLLAKVERAAVQGQVALNGQPLKWGAVSLVADGEDGKWRPSAWAMVRRGTFSVTAAAGAPVGRCKVAIIDWGSVEPQPTREDAIEYSSLTIEVRPGDNTFDFDVAKP